MDAEKRTKLTSELSSLSTAIAADLSKQILTCAAVRAKAEKLHADERVGEDFEVWTDLLSRRAAVLWVLKSVYVRVLEDRGLLGTKRLVDPEAQQLFEKLAPNLGPSAFLAWLYRDLAQPAGGLPELFAPQPAEVARPSDDLSADLVALWRHRDPDTDALMYAFDDERFDGQLMGDLYQDLDPVVKDRYALLQTPDFVRDFILDQTLTPALEEWGADVVRLLDPACGSGHFLLEAFRRLVEALARQHADWSARERVEHALERIVGIDLNDYACALARARLVMLGAELAGVTDLADAGSLHPHIYWADALEQVEREDPADAQLPLLGEVPEEARRAIMTQPEVRAALKPELEGRFHVVVANPPYITEKDKGKKAYHRQKVGGEKRYVSAYREYSLASPFTERCFQLAVKRGFVGLITSNNFMKRSFGIVLVERVLAPKDLYLVVDTAGARIPGHGTPTVLLFARNQARSAKARVRAVMGKRGEPPSTTDPRRGLVWTSIVKGYQTDGWENEFVSVSDIPRSLLDEHPWSLRGGGATSLQGELDESAVKTLETAVDVVGYVCMTRADDIYFVPRDALKRCGVDAEHIIENVKGDRCRDWGIWEPNTALFPYNSELEPATASEAPAVHDFLWPYRTTLWLRREPNGNHREIGLTWWEWSRFQRERYRRPLAIVMAFVATHNHFVLDRGGKVFKQSAPVIKLPEDATEDDHLDLLGLLNSSTACFWMKQVFHCKGAQGINEGAKAEQWEQFYEFDGTKIKGFPIPERASDTRPYARALDALAAQRTADSVAAILDSDSWSSAAALTKLLEARRDRDLSRLRTMVALQEELDWCSYGTYNLIESPDLLAVDAVVEVDPTTRPTEVLLARRDKDVREALDRGETPLESPTAWFERHGWTPATELPSDLPDHVRDLYARRLEQIPQVKALKLIEKPNYKRRWYNPDYRAEEESALREWVLDRAEHALEGRARPATPAQLTAALGDDRRVLAACEVWTGDAHFDLQALLAKLLKEESVPNHPRHRYKPAGLKKRAVWERTWELQRREDAGEDVGEIPVPPKYKKSEFLKGAYYSIRGRLDVPKERFIAFTEVPGREGSDTLYGWAGWTARQRARALVRIDEDLDDAGVSVSDRVAVLDSVWRLLPDIQRDNPEAASQYRDEVRGVLGRDEGPSDEAVKQWHSRYPKPTN